MRRSVVIEPREDVEGMGDGVQVGEGRKLLAYGMSLSVVAAETDWDLALSVTLSFLPRSARFSSFIGLSS